MKKASNRGRDRGHMHDTSAGSFRADFGQHRTRDRDRDVREEQPAQQRFRHGRRDYDSHWSGPHSHDPRGYGQRDHAGQDRGVERADWSSEPLDDRELVPVRSRGRTLYDEESYRHGRMNAYGDEGSDTYGRKGRDLDEEDRNRSYWSENRGVEGEASDRYRGRDDAEGYRGRDDGGGYDRDFANAARPRADRSTRRR